jgi:hypothetical protein
MYPLAAGLLIGSVMPFYKFDLNMFLFSFIERVRRFIVDLRRGQLDPEFTKPTLSLLLSLFILLFSSAAIGCFIVIGQMLIEYGTCKITSF